MKILFVYCHPEPTSFTHALLDAGLAIAREGGHEVEVSDLYAEGFNPVAGRHDFVTEADPARFHYQTEQLHAAQNQGYCAEIAREQGRVAWADYYVFLFPLWWGGLPAILKGWFDRVLSYGFAYVDGARFDSGLFKGRGAMLGVVTGGTAERFSDGGTYGSIKQVLWPTVHCQMEYLGLDIAPPFVAYAAPRVGDEGRAALLADWKVALGDALTRHAAAGVPRTELTVPEVAGDWASG